MTNLLAVVSVAQLRHPLDDHRMAGFVAGIDPVNRLAEASPGFVWRCRGVAGHSALLDAEEGGELLVNVSLWQTYLDFHRFTYRGAHGRYLSARARWFVSIPGPTTALWWSTGRDTSVDVEAALIRLRLLRRDGPSPHAFSVLRQWDADGRPIRRPDPVRRPARR
jgi:hypothetical protein